MSKRFQRFLKLVFDHVLNLFMVYKTQKSHRSNNLSENHFEKD